VPYRLVGQKVDMRICANVVEVFQGSKKIAAHPRAVRRRGFTTQDAHMPESHKAGQWTPERLMRWAEKTGPEASLFVSRVLSSKAHKEHGHRTILGVLRLEKSFGKQRLEAACRRANAIGSLSYSSVKSILDKKLETSGFQPELPSLPAHTNVRGAAYFHGDKTCAN
jgi:hypothetical protein